MKTIGAGGRPVEVLLVEDSPGDVRLTQEALRGAQRRIHLHVAFDGVEAMAFQRHFLSKPVQLEAFESLVRSINDFWLATAKLPLQVAGQ